jgi:hypothetical protein
VHVLKKSTFPTRKKGCSHIQFESHGSFEIQREPVSVDVQREPVSVDVQRKGNGFNIFNLVTCNIKNGCCVHLRLLTAIENNFAGDVMDCNGTVALIF